MNTSRPAPGQKKGSAPAPGKAQRADDDITPPPTGANRGSPAARVMKQSAKTKAESSGRS